MFSLQSQKRANYQGHNRGFEPTSVVWRTTNFCTMYTNFKTNTFCEISVTFRGMPGPDTHDSLVQLSMFLLGFKTVPKQVVLSKYQILVYTEYGVL